MSILFYILSVILSSSPSESTPISPSLLHQPILLTNCSTSTPTEFGQRSIWDIVWGCLVTIFACSWVSVHPQIPPPDSKWWEIALIRFELMVWTILAPELVIFLAVKQYIAARLYSKYYQDRGWTITHGFFLQMGGFMLFEDGVRKGSLLSNDFRKLLEAKKITFPEITEEEIKDRSKGDGLSKGLVLVQVSWFVIQFIARIVTGLAITKLELATFAFAVMNGFMYLFWWNKPLDIRVSIPVHLIPQLEETNDAISSYPAISDSSEPGIKPPLQDQPLDPAISNGSLRQAERESWGSVIAEAILDRIGIISDDTDFELLNTMSLPIIFFIIKRSLAGVSLASGISIVLGTVFGAIHCAGWNLESPSIVEGHMWRIASVIIVVCPLSISLAPIIRKRSDEFIIMLVICGITRSGTIFMEGSFFGFCFMYVVARLLTLVEAFLALRQLPFSATYIVQWTTVLPHV